MHAQRFFGPSAILGLVTLLLSLAQPGLAQAQCASPLTPGAWVGPINSSVTGQGTTRAGTSMSMSNTVTSAVSLQVACDGSVTGQVSDQMTVQITAGRLGGTCKGTSTLTVTSGRATLGAGN